MKWCQSNRIRAIVWELRKYCPVNPRETKTHLTKKLYVLSSKLAVWHITRTGCNHLHLPKDRSLNHAKTQTWKEQLGSFSSRARLHGHEHQLRPTQRQAGNDRTDSGSRRTRHDVFRHRPGLRPVHERRTGGRSTCSLPWASGDWHQVRVRVRFQRTA